VDLGTLSGTVVVSPAVSGASGSQVAFVGGIKGSLVALSVATGAKLWTAPGTSAGYYASPACPMAASSMSTWPATSPPTPCRRPLGTGLALASVRGRAG
jgi:outer membrane protein assembly factor BamB